MERERPEYLAPIERERRGFPWLPVIGIVLGATMIGGVGIYLKTAIAWEERFAAGNQQPRAAGQPPAPVIDKAQEDRQRALMKIRMTREAAQRKQAGYKCVNGTLFRPIPGGGWENVPGEHC